MENSNTLPKIEVGDTVIFRTDLRIGHHYGRLFLTQDMMGDINSPSSVFETEDFGFRTEEYGYWFTPEMVAQVIKPTKERAYTEQEMRQCWDAATHDALSIGDENYMLLTFKDFIESLNK